MYRHVGEKRVEQISALIIHHQLKVRNISCLEFYHNSDFLAGSLNDYNLFIAQLCNFQLFIIL